MVCQPSYHDKGIEEAYQKEVSFPQHELAPWPNASLIGSLSGSQYWYTSKSRHIFGSLYLILNWVRERSFRM